MRRTRNGRGGWFIFQTLHGPLVPASEAGLGKANGARKSALTSPLFKGTNSVENARLSWIRETRSEIPKRKKK